MLRDEQILELAAIGRHIKTCLYHSQDIEWCLFEKSFISFKAVRLPPYTLPEDDGKNRVYISMVHLQMMTDPIKPLGMSFCRFLLFWFRKNLVPAGGRLFVDETYDLRSPIGRKILISSIAKADILMKNAISKLMVDKDFVKALLRGKGAITIGAVGFSWIIKAINIYRENNPETVEALIACNEKLISVMEKKL